MIITITGDLGSGKSTVAKIVAKKLNLKHYSTGDMMRAIAQKKGISITELGKELEQAKDIDNQIDEQTKQLANKEDNFVIDSRLAWHFIKKSFKIYLKVDQCIGAKRILKNNRQDEKASSVEQMIEKNKKRKASENKRYKEYYKLDIHNMNQYDLVINTDNITAEQVAEKIIKELAKHL